MKKLLILILAFMPLLAVSQKPYCGMYVEFNDCAVRKPGNNKDVWDLQGRVRVIKNTNEYATFNIFVTKGDSDMVVFVKKNEDTFFGCGVWQWVENDEKFTVRFVDTPKKAHFSVRFVESQSDWHGCDVCDD